MFFHNMLLEPKIKLHRGNLSLTVYLHWNMPVYLRKMEQLPKEQEKLVFLFTVGFLINQPCSLKLASFSRITIKGNYEGGKEEQSYDLPSSRICPED